MSTVRITTNWRHPERMEWVGAPTIDRQGHIERSVEVPEEAIRGIESAISRGNIEGNVYLADHTRFHWFLDR